MTIKSGNMQNKKIYLEIGGGVAGTLSAILPPDWRDQKENLGHLLPGGFWEWDVTWHGYIIEPIPENFIQIIQHRNTFNLENLTCLLGAVAGRSNFQNVSLKKV